MKELKNFNHVDQADLTVNICLGRKFEGGRLFFYGLRENLTEDEKLHVPPLYPSEKKPPVFWYDHRVGEGVFHLGEQYRTEEIRSVERINLIIWCRSTKVEFDSKVHWQSAFDEIYQNQDELQILEKYLEKSDSHPEAMDSKGRNLLQTLVIAGLEAHVKCLLCRFKCDIDVDARDFAGSAALHYAAENNDIAISK